MRTYFPHLSKFGILKIDIFIFAVLTRIQEECDRQTEKVLAEFRKKRSVKDKAVKVREAMYSSSSSHHGSGSSSHLDQKRITAKDLDHVLSEMTLLEARAEMYYKFVRKRVAVSLRIGLLEKYIWPKIICFSLRSRAI